MTPNIWMKTSNGIVHVPTGARVWLEKSVRGFEIKGCSGHHQYVIEAFEAEQPALVLFEGLAVLLGATKPEHLAGVNEWRAALRP